MDSSPTNQHVRRGLRIEIRERTLAYVLGAFGLIAGLAWNDAIQSMIAYVFPVPGNTIPAKFLYAVIVSFIAVTISVYIARLLERLETLADNGPSK